ncbi:MAG TPA: TetR/AcrR family transcriptional regulator [Thermoanaerobaculia bacterium]|nr:TetR/AcrR family transcriptional regulator [Thermoanaerobaculia bacterium]
MKKRRVGRPRDGDPARTRREILRAAEESFASSGFAGATTRGVAARAGVNVATLHYHFGSKERLYRAVLEAAAAEDLLPAPRGASPADRLASVVESLWNLGWGRPSLSRLSLLDRILGPASSAGGTRGVIPDPRARLLERTIGDAATGSRMRAEDAARLVLVLLDGALVAARTGPGDGEGAPAAPREAVVAAALRLTGLA